MGFIKPLWHCSLMVKSCFIIYSANAFAGDSENKRLMLLQKAEQHAISEVLSTTDRRLFEHVSTLPLLAFITPMEVMDYKTRKKIRQRTVEIIRSDIDKLNNHETTVLKASEELYQAALKQTTIQGIRKLDRNYQLERFKRYLQNKKKTVQAEAKKTLSLYEASQIIERWGVDPYDFVARPYYCALGIYGLDTMSSYGTRFCS